MPEPVKVLFIGGSGRSGSTLTDRMLGSVPSVCSVGELWALWKRDMQRDEFCGCGLLFADCPFWRDVVAEAFGTVDAARASGFAQTQRNVLYHHRGLAVRWPQLMRQRRRPDFGRFAEERARVIRAIAAVSGADLIVDSSKVPRYGSALAAVPGLEVRALHLVRDSRAIAHSWSMAKETRRVGGGSVLMPRYPAALSASRFVARSLQMEGAWRFTDRLLTLNYEAFVAAPSAWTKRILRFAGHPAPAAPPRGLKPHTFRLLPTHTILGNPMRFDRGEVLVRRDDRWRTEMDARDRRLVTRRTWPLLLRYGYIGPFKASFARDEGSN